MKIEKIVKLKSSKYKIYFDDSDSIITYDNVILNYNLLYKKEIDNELYSQIKEENIYYELLNNSIKYISKRLRSEKEIRDYLNKKSLDIHLIDNIILELKNNNLINDQKFTQAYINDKLNFSNIGINKIKKELYFLGVDEEIIEQACLKIDFKNDQNKLEQMIIKKIKLNHKYSNNFLKQKILNDMINLGYNRDDILDICERNLKSDKEIYEKEYKKVYDKLKKKYQGTELNYYVKKQMISKGF